MSKPDGPAPPSDLRDHLERYERFEKALTDLINSHNIERRSNTPDFILARHLMRCLNAFEDEVNARELWYGRGTATVSTGK